MLFTRQLPAQRDWWRLLVLVMALAWAFDGRSTALATLLAAITGIFGMSLLLLSPQTLLEPLV